MVNVSYSHALSYGYDSGRGRPMLRVQVGNPRNRDLAIQTLAHLDSGTDMTIFRGDVCSVIGIELMAGPEKRFQTSVIGASSLVAHVHRAKLVHEVLGEYDIEIAFSTQPIPEIFSV